MPVMANTTSMHSVMTPTRTELIASRILFKTGADGRIAGLAFMVSSVADIYNKKNIAAAVVCHPLENKSCLQQKR